LALCVETNLVERLSVGGGGGGGAAGELKRGGGGTKSLVFKALPVAVWARGGTRR